MTIEVGERLVVEVGPVAHGGHMVARHDGRVFFVRHALPGERVEIVVTEVSRRFARADAVTVLVASPDRVEAPCPVAGAGLCGGCDFQHVALSTQRELKAQVVAEQLRRLAGIEREITVEPVAGDQDGLRWRTRMRYVALADGGRGMRQYRSHDLVPVEDCLLEHPEARVVVEGRATARAEADRTETVTVTETVATSYGTKQYEVARDGFWQVHPGAPRVLVETVLDYAAVQAGDRVWDLYAGVGLFSAFLADAIGEIGRLLVVEGDRRAAENAQRNLSHRAGARVVRGRVEQVVRRHRGKTDVVVLDPPRTGAKRDVVAAIANAEPRRVVYVACDPAALARDLAYFADHGYHLDDLRAFDLFPMTHHVECVALLTKSGSDLR